MAERELPPEVQKDLQQLQQLSQNLQMTMQQRLQFEAMQAETTEAVGALEGLASDAAVYRSIGSLLVEEKDRDALLTRLKDELETLEVRVKRSKSQEEQLRKTAMSLQESIQGKLK